jgi:SAM-dependent methyltransferase
MTVHATDNLALAAPWQTPGTGRSLAWDADRAVFADDAGEVFPCFADDIPDFRRGERRLGDDEVDAIRQRLATAWDEAEAGVLPPQALTIGPEVATRRYWRQTARGETWAFAAWCARGFPRYRQRDSMRRYRTVTDVYPGALRRPVTVLAGDHVATAPLAFFKRLSLDPLVELIREREIRSVLDFGCGWGANTIILRQLFPDLEVWSFDYSPERVVNAQFNLRRLGLTAYRLFLADGSRLPLPDGAVDLVVSTHVLEQRHEVLPAAMRETYRVTRRFACHVEPTYRFAHWPHRLRLRRLGYPRDIRTSATTAGWHVREHAPATPAWGRTPGELLLLEKPAP